MPNTFNVQISRNDLFDFFKLVLLEDSKKNSFHFSSPHTFLLIFGADTQKQLALWVPFRTFIA